MMARFFQELQSLSSEGGWVLWGLMALAFGIAFSLLSLWRSLSLNEAPVLAPRDWRLLLGRREVPPEPLSRLRAALGDGDVERALEEIDHRLFAAPTRRFPFAFVLIGAAPLVGLLGTVSGMFTTFDGMAGVAATAPVDVISRGVSEALITTQAGLVIGVPSFIVCSMLKERFDQLLFSYQRVVSQLLQPES